MYQKINVGNDFYPALASESGVSFLLPHISFSEVGAERIKKLKESGLPTYAIFRASDAEIASKAYVDVDLNTKAGACYSKIVEYIQGGILPSDAMDTFFESVAADTFDPEDWPNLH